MRLSSGTCDLSNMVENTFELIQRVVTDDQFSLAAAALLNPDHGTQLVGQAAFKAAYVGILRFGRPGRPTDGLSLLQTAYQFFGFANRQPPGGDLLRRFALDLPLEAEQGAGMSHFQAALFYI